MKKISMLVAAVVVVAGLSSFAYADPGRSDGRRGDMRHEQAFKHEKHKHDEHYYHYYHDGHHGHHRPYGQPVAARMAPVAFPAPPPARVVRPHAPNDWAFWPNVVITVH